jgi:hypothetical protein
VKKDNNRWTALMYQLATHVETTKAHQRATFQKQVNSKGIDKNRIEDWIVTPSETPIHNLVQFVKTRTSLLPPSHPLTRASLTVPILAQLYKQKISFVIIKRPPPRRQEFMAVGNCRRLPREIRPLVLLNTDTRSHKARADQ